MKIYVPGCSITYEQQKEKGKEEKDKEEEERGGGEERGKEKDGNSLEVHQEELTELSIL